MLSCSQGHAGADPEQQSLWGPLVSTGFCATFLPPVRSPAVLHPRGSREPSGPNGAGSVDPERPGLGSLLQLRVETWHKKGPACPWRPEGGVQLPWGSAGVGARRGGRTGGFAGL